MTLLDFPGHVACTVFTVGCNFRCPFCHNSALVGSLPEEETIREEDFFAFLESRKKILDGVAVTGGEPLLQPDIKDFIQKIRAAGYAVKLDTNGSFPEKLKELVNEGLVDYVAMDVKNAPAKLAETIGTEKWAAQITESLSFLKSQTRVPFEFRTTAVHELHTAEDFAALAGIIAPVDRYFIQCFKDSGAILEDGLTAPSMDEMKSFLAAVRPLIPGAEVRGIDLL